MGAAGVIRHLAAGRNREGRACDHRRPPGTGSRRRQAALIVARDWSGLAAKASRRRGILVVSRHPGIKRKGLAVLWLTHYRYRLVLSWTIRSRS